MVKSLRHRGPDDDGFYIGEHIALGHARLAILDLSNRAAQPMRSHDGRYVLAYNGEIFNFRSLRSELESRGIRLQSSGDTEVLLEYIVNFGLERALPLLEGDWAFALWDTWEVTLVLARDRHGVKPLYYSDAASGDVRFASEMKALLTDERPDMTTLNASLLGLSGTWGRNTVFHSVRSVCPGEWLVFRGSTVPERHQFFSLADFVDPSMYRELSRSSGAEVTERVAAELEASVDLRMISDAPLASLVSGGIDSSLITTIAAGRNPHIGIYHADVSSDSERPAAQLLAKHLSLTLRSTQVSDQDIIDNIAAVTYANELPLIYHLNSVPFFLVSRLAQGDGIKVLLTGEGSDEYFLGYPQIALEPLMQLLNSPKRALQDAFFRIAPRAAKLLWPKSTENFSELLKTLVFRFEEQLVRNVGEEAFDFIPSARARRYHVSTLALAQGHLLSLLHRNDRLGMAWGLESRFPFLGHGLVKLAINLPGRHKLHKGLRFHDSRHPFITDKWCVRKVGERHLPAVLSRRQKQGFPVSIYHRMDADPEFLTDGFVANEYGLDRSALDMLVSSAPRVWLARMILLEVWGLLFVHRLDVDAVQGKLEKFVKPLLKV